MSLATSDIIENNNLGFDKDKSKLSNLQKLNLKQASNIEEIS